MSKSHQKKSKSVPKKTKPNVEPTPQVAKPPEECLRIEVENHRAVHLAQHLLEFLDLEQTTESEQMLALALFCAGQLVLDRDDGAAWYVFRRSVSLSKLITLQEPEEKPIGKEEVN